MAVASELEDEGAGSGETAAADDFGSSAFTREDVGETVDFGDSGLVLICGSI